MSSTASGRFFGRMRSSTLGAQLRITDADVLWGITEDGEVTPVVGRTYPLGEAPGAIRYVREGHARGKVVVTVV
ncbi:zinc-binding dehydrogenase [Streptomyces sp. NPDC004838]